MEIVHLIDKAVPLPDFTILLFFNTGDLKLLDMKPLIRQGGVWSEIAQWSAFSGVRVQDDLGGLEWEGEIDVCPETAFADAEPCPPHLLRDVVEAYADHQRRESQRDPM